ncbi:MAG: phosphotransferase [Chloroflexi bacterium]|nr:phosphotransferase [Chloroflexota bacterium]
MARAATGDGGLDVASWDYETVQGGFGSAVGGTGLFRFRLRSVAGETCSLILKILYERKGEDPGSPYFWKREYEIYRSGLLKSLPADTFVAPQIFATEDFGDSCWIWMEDIKDSKSDWTLSDFHDIALRLGRFNGAWLEDASPPSPVWLCRDWHSAIVPGLVDSFANLDRLLESPLARAALPIEAKDEISAIWNDRGMFQAALAELPRTLCHTDAFRRNVMHRDDDVILLDWALASIGRIGEDLVCLVAVSLFYDRFSASYAQQLDETAFTGYIAGLRQAGWRGDSKLARIGFTCGMVLRGLAGVKQDLEMLRDPAEHQRLQETHHNLSLPEIARFFADVRRFRLIRMAREARDLLSG